MPKKPLDIIADAEMIEDHEISDNTLKAMGTIALVGAELDDLLSAVIFDIAKINPSDGYLLLGRSAISGKSQIYEYLLKKYAGAEAVANFKVIRHPLKTFLGYRNSICHGVYVGMHKKSKALIFLRTADTLDPEDGVTIHTASGFTPQQIETMASLGPKLLGYFRAPFDGKSSREIHLQRLQRGRQPRPRPPRENGHK